MGARERRRGHDLERFVAKTLSDYGFPSKRVLEYQAGTGWDVESEVECEADPKIRVQAKQRKVISWIKEVDDSCRVTGLADVLFWVLRQDRGRAMAVLPLGDLCKLLAWSKATGLWKRAKEVEEELSS